MQIKYDIELTINGITNKGQMEIYDDNIKLYIDDKIRTVMFDKMKNNVIEKGLLKIILYDETEIYIKTVKAEIINDFIKLQKESDVNCSVTYLTTSQRFMKIYITTFIFMFILIALLNFDDFSLIGAIFGALLPSLFIAYIIHAFVGHKNDVFATCPYCNQKLFINHSDAQGFKFSLISKGNIGTFPCEHCGNMIGMKYDHLYKLTPQNESEFNRQIKPLNQAKQVQQTNVETTNNINENDFDKLEKLKELLDKNLITQEDYEKKKQDILNKL